LDFFKRIFKRFCNINENKEESITYVQLGDQLKNAEPCERFALLFEHLGGSLNRCTNENELRLTLRKILKQEKLNSAFCCEGCLQKILKKIKFKYTESLDVKNDVALISCEYLIAFDARIMLSYSNIKYFSSSSLPEKIIIIANDSQIAADLNYAMMKVKRKGIPKNLTSISGNISELDFPGRKKHKLYLLLRHCCT